MASAGRRLRVVGRSCSVGRRRHASAVANLDGSRKQSTVASATH